jgi:hypothetical protein
MNFFRFVRDRWLSVYSSAVLVSFGLGFLLKSQGPRGSSFLPATLLTLPWSALPTHVLPEPVYAFLNAFYDLPLILASMTLNIAFVGLVQWISFWASRRVG